MSEERRPQPMRPGKGVRVPGQKADMKTVKRVLGYLTSHWGRLIFVLAGIIVSALAGVYGAQFLKVLVDNYIEPLLLEEAPDLSELAFEIIKLGVIYVCGAVSTFVYNRLMVTVSQSVLQNVRDTMFAKMQKLPVKYFDTHSFGDTMSRYTNDTDTLRMMISQSIPHIVSSLFTIIAVFVAMLVNSVWLTLFVVATAFLMMLLVKTIGGKSGSYFVKQQRSVGRVNGFIEEMINGQKVVQVFTREEKTKAEFNEINDELCENAKNANIFANILGPIMNNLSHLQYILIAVIGGALAVYTQSISLGGIVAFLQLSKS